MAVERDTASLDATKKFKVVLKKKATQLKQGTKKETELNRVFLALEEAQKSYISLKHSN